MADVPEVKIAMKKLSGKVWKVVSCSEEVECEDNALKTADMNGKEKTQVAVAAIRPSPIAGSRHRSRDQHLPQGTTAGNWGPNLYGGNVILQRDHPDYPNNIVRGSPSPTAYRYAKEPYAARGLPYPYHEYEPRDEQPKKPRGIRGNTLNPPDNDADFTDNSLAVALIPEKPTSNAVAIPGTVALVDSPPDSNDALILVESSVGKKPEYDQSLPATSLVVATLFKVDSFLQVLSVAACNDFSSGKAESERRSLELRDLRLAATVAKKHCEIEALLLRLDGVLNGANVVHRTPEKAYQLRNWLLAFLFNFNTRENGQLPILAAMRIMIHFLDLSCRASPYLEDVKIYSMSFFVTQTMEQLRRCLNDSVPHIYETILKSHEMKCSKYKSFIMKFLLMALRLPKDNVTAVNYYRNALVYKLLLEHEVIKEAHNALAKQAEQPEYLGIGQTKALLLPAHKKSSEREFSGKRVTRYLMTNECYAVLVENFMQFHQLLRPQLAGIKTEAPTVIILDEDGERLEEVSAIPVEDLTADSDEEECRTSADKSSTVLTVEEESPTSSEQTSPTHADEDEPTTSSEKTSSTLADEEEPRTSSEKTSTLADEEKSRTSSEKTSPPLADEEESRTSAEKITLPVADEGECMTVADVEDVTDSDGDEPADEEESSTVASEHRDQHADAERSQLPDECDTVPMDISSIDEVEPVAGIETLAAAKPLAVSPETMSCLVPVDGPDYAQESVVPALVFGDKKLLALPPSQLGSEQPNDRTQLVPMITKLRDEETYGDARRGTKRTVEEDSGRREFDPALNSEIASSSHGYPTNAIMDDPAEIQSFWDSPVDLASTDCSLLGVDMDLQGLLDLFTEDVSSTRPITPSKKTGSLEKQFRLPKYGCIDIDREKTEKARKKQVTEPEFPKEAYTSPPSHRTRSRKKSLVESAEKSKELGFHSPSKRPCEDIPPKWAPPPTKRRRGRPRKKRI